jgi:chemotaxis response regulator CheB
MATSENNHHHLSELLGDAGLDVVMHETAGDEFLQQLEKVPADVLLVDLCDDTDSEVEVIETLLDYDSLPILFNDSSTAGGETNSRWAKQLAHKLMKMVVEFEPIIDVQTKLDVDDLEVDIDEELVDKSKQNAEDNVDLISVNTESTGIAEGEFDDDISSEKIESSIIDLHPDAAINVWVLGASLGGPQAVRQFVMSIKSNLPVAFILAQHIGANHMSLLAEQLNRVTKFKVFTGYTGHMIRHHEIILAPTGKQISITPDGYVALKDEPPNTIYSPCINDVISAVAERYGDMAGTIVFSGMGDDGAVGCRSMAEHGGVVWAQDVDSCVMSSMPDQARKTNNVTFSAEPRKLAEELYAYYKE